MCNRQFIDICTCCCSVGPRNLFWESLEEAKISFDEFDDLFSKVPVQPKKKAKDAKPKAKMKQVRSLL